MKRVLLATLLVSGAMPASSAVAQYEPVETSWGAPGELAVSPDGENVYATGRSRTMAFSRTDSGQLDLIPGGIPGGEHIVVTPDGAFAYIAAWDRINILRRDAASGALEYQATISGYADSPAPLGEISGMAISPDGNQLYASSRTHDALTTFRIGAGGSLEVHEMLLGGPGLIPGLQSPAGPVISPDGRYVYVAGSDGATEGTAIFARDSGTGALSLSTFDPAALGEGTVAPNGARYYTFDTVFARDADTGALSELASCNCGLTRLVSPDSAALYRFMGWLSRIQQVPVTADGIGATSRVYVNGQDGIDGLSQPEQGAFSPDGANVYVASSADPGPLGTAPFGQATIAAFRRAASNDLDFVESYRPTYIAYPPGTPATVSIDDGALYTRSAGVTVTIACPYREVGGQLSNSPDMSDATRVGGVGSYPWTLAATNGGRDVRRVYARCFYAEGPVLAASDDIILDQQPPELGAATLRGRRLRLRATDNRSKVVAVRLKSSRKRRPVAIEYHRRVRLPRRFGRVWLKLVDGAGNKSDWRKVRAERRR